MRVIRFNAWDKVAERMLLDVAKPDCSVWLDDCTVWSFTEMLAHTERFVLLQYTGITDRNGEEVYEGDIVLKMGNGNAEVVWDEYEFGYMLDMHQCGDNIEVGSPHYIVKVGNIYENRELLDDGK